MAWKGSLQLHIVKNYAVIRGELQNVKTDEFLEIKYPYLKIEASEAWSSEMT